MAKYRFLKDLTQYQTNNDAKNKCTDQIDNLSTMTFLVTFYFRFKLKTAVNIAIEIFILSHFFVLT